MAEESDDAPAADEGAVLSPNELDISNDDNVVEIDDGRYVIAPGDDEPTLSPVQEQKGASEPTGSGDGDALSERSMDLDAVHDWLGTYLGDADSEYAFDVSAVFEGRLAQKALFSNDVVTTFENLVVWYAHHVGGDTPVEDVIGILVMESNLSIRFPEPSLRAFAATHGLDGDDTIDDLLAAVRDEGGIDFPPSDR